MWYMCCFPRLQALASATASGNGANAVAQVIAEAFASGGNAAAVAEAVAGAFGKNKGGTTTALASALAQANSDGGKTGAAAQAVAQVRVVLTGPHAGQSRDSTVRPHSKNKAQRNVFDVPANVTAVGCWLVAHQRLCAAPYFYCEAFPLSP
jgi:hypothetical protein